MGAIEHLTISLPAEMAERVQAWLATGDYQNVDDVILDALLGMGRPEDRDSDPEVEHWLRTEVASIYDRMKLDPSRGIPIEQVAAKLEADRIARGE